MHMSRAMRMHMHMHVHMRTCMCMCMPCACILCGKCGVPPTCTTQVLIGEEAVVTPVRMQPVLSSWCGKAAIIEEGGLSKVTRTLAPSPSPSPNPNPKHQA
jgi:hypothetical protein